MSAQIKVLIAFGAIAAFVIGFSINMSRSSNEVDTSTLLSAQLIESESSSETTYASVEDTLGELTLVNFWATWCMPCREEMPIFETMYRQANSNGFVVIGIAIDSPEKAQPMLDSMDITYPILYALETGAEIMETIGNANGLLPYSLLLDKNGNVIEQVLGQIHEQEINEWLAAHL
ncbi:MAG: TlpA family protein disulfide reductase [Acidiferrobacterales bacterium]|nr:TlpA family protein disulfide reductase [Acidiferrobacterales bacterium]